MQTVIDVYCTRGRSLREAIASDKYLEKYGLSMVRAHQPGRAPGWAKLRGDKPDRQGSVNIDWDANANILRCRVVNRGRGRPNLIVGDLVEYLMARHRRRIVVMLIVPHRQSASDAH